VLVAAARIGDQVAVMGRRMTRRGDHGHDRVAELDHLTVAERDVLERHIRPRRQVAGRSGALRECRQPRDVIGLYVRLEGRDALRQLINDV